MNQNNTKVGILTLATVASLIGFEGHLVKVGNDNGTLIAALPTSITDETPFFIVNVNSATEVEVAPFTAEGNHRIKLKGTCNPGDLLVLADPATAADRGKLRTGTGLIKAVAEEIGVEGQALLVRQRSRVLTAAVTDTTGNGVAAGAADLAALKTETEKIGDALRDLLAKLNTAGVITLA